MTYVSFEGVCKSFDDGTKAVDDFKLEIKEINNVGKIVTYTIQTVAPDPFVNEVPYAWVIVELDEKIRITGWIPFISSEEELEIGQKVKLVKSYKPGMVFEKISE